MEMLFLFLLFFLFRAGYNEDRSLVIALRESHSDGCRRQHIRWSLV
jgi:hypothetical protein